jgi:hypothetical protein
MIVDPKPDKDRMFESIENMGKSLFKYLMADDDEKKRILAQAEKEKMEQQREFDDQYKCKCCGQYDIPGKFG